MAVDHISLQQSIQLTTLNKLSSSIQFILGNQGKLGTNFLLGSPLVLGIHYILGTQFIFIYLSTHFTSIKWKIGQLAISVCNNQFKGQHCKAFASRTQFIMDTQFMLGPITYWVLTLCPTNMSTHFN